jgi:hypothetical protein
MVRTRRRDAGISMVLVVILIVITIGLVVWAVGIWSEYKFRDRQSKMLREVLDRQIPAEASEIKAQISKINEAAAIGGSNDANPENQKAIDYLKAKRQEYWSPDNLNKYPLTAPINEKGDPVPRKDVEKGKADDFNRAREESQVNGSLQELVRIATARAFHYKARMDQLQLELDIAKDQVKNREAIKPDIPKLKIAKKAELLAEIQKVTQQIAQENETYNARKAAFAEAKTKAEAETAAEVAKYAEDEIKVINETRELHRQLEDLKFKEVIKHEIAFIHGRIMRPDVPNKTAFIDIGSRERVVPGLKFLVGRRGFQDKFEYKAKVEVKKVWMTYSEVAILDVFSPKEKPVVDGDTIVNPLFSKDRPIVVAFVGEDRPVKLRYSVDEASRRIMEIGSLVRKEVTLDVDYVIFTETGSQRQRDSYDAYKKAILLEIPIAEAGRVKDEPERPGLFEFLGD